MDDDDAKHILLNMRRTILDHYPIPEGSVVDARYAMAFGLILGICTECIQAVQQDRAMNVRLSHLGRDL